jgi:hypothetical protein
VQLHLAQRALTMQQHQEAATSATLALTQMQLGAYLSHFLET